RTPPSPLRSPAPSAICMPVWGQRASVPAPTRRPPYPRRKRRWCAGLHAGAQASPRTSAAGTPKSTAPRRANGCARCATAAATGGLKTLSIEVPTRNADPAARQFAASLRAAYARRPLPFYPATGIRTGDDIATKLGERPLITQTHSAIVRGLATFRGRRVVVV